MEITEELRAKYWPEFESKYAKVAKVLKPEQLEEQFRNFVERQLDFERRAAQAQEMAEAASQPAKDKLAADQAKLARELAEIDRKMKKL